MDDLISSIFDHSHYDGADWANDKFWQNLWDAKGAEYQAQTDKPSFSDFQVWAEDNNLVPDSEYQDD